MRTHLITNLYGSMKKIIALLITLLALTGCVQTQYHKNVTVVKDSAGNLVSTTISETVVQPGQGWPVKFEHLRGVRTDE